MSGARRLRIAVVEDNPDNRMLLAALLGEDYDLDQYDSGVAAIRGIREAPPDLVLLDISLPEVDGTAVLEELRAAGPTAGVPVVALTAHAMPGDRDRYLAMGFDDYVAKPIVDEEVLTSCIARLAEGGRAR